LITVVPVTLEVSVVVHEPVPPDVVHVALLRLPGPLAMVKLIVVPLGALTKPVPGLTFTCPVRVCVSSIKFVAVAGLIWMLASTKVFCAGPLLPALPLVVRVNVTPLTVTLAEALITVVPGVLEVSVVVHEPVPPEVVHVALLRLPGPLTMLNVIVVPSGALASPLPMSTFTWPVRVWV